MSDTTKPTPKGSDKDAVIQRMDQRFTRAQEWESTTRELEKEDKRFANADPDHPEWQWPGDVQKARNPQGGTPRPCLVINKVRQHNLLIINDSRENKPSVKVHATGFGAMAEAAQVFEGVIRHIEYKSKASAVYVDATRHQVESGVGYWRIVTEYPNDDSFEQEIFIRRIIDPFSVYMDPDAQEIDKSDARWCFVFRDLPREEFEAEFPEYKDLAGAQSMENSTGGGNDWRSKDTVRIAEYYERHALTDTLWAVPQDFLGQGHPGGTLRESQMIDGLADAAKAGGWPSRPHENIVVRWYMRVGDEIVDSQDTAYNTIPIVTLIGEEFVVDGKLNRRGHTRSLKDAQRMYNYYASAAVEFGALQTKVPWIVGMKSIEGLETYWETANTTNHAYLPYNETDDSGQKTGEPPQRPAPPQTSPVYIDGMQTAEVQMMMASGQYQNEFGQQGNERSGIAIQERQRQGDKATYHYIDNLGVAIAYTGRILIDLIPKVYDTKRVIQIMAEDGTISDVHLDPNAAQAHQAQPGTPAAPPQPGQGPPPPPVEQIIFNPLIGRYAVEAEMGPGYATRREEAFNAFQQIVSTPSGALYMDLFFKSADFPMAEEAAERARAMLPPQATGGPPPELVQAQQQVQQLHGALVGANQAVADMKRKLDDKDDKNDTEKYRAETDRITSLHDIDPDMFKPLIRQVVLEALRDQYGGDAPPVTAVLPHPNTPPAPPPVAPDANPQGVSP
jgi:hypothetical protein